MAAQSAPVSIMAPITALKIPTDDRRYVIIPRAPAPLNKPNMRSLSVVPLLISGGRDKT